MNDNLHADFSNLYNLVHEQFVKYCSHHSYGMMETDDLVQESILKTMTNFSTIKEKSKLLSFMISVANNIIRSNYRRRKFHGVYDEKKMHHLESHIADPSMLVEIQFLYKALHKLQIKDKEAILLFEISGYSIREIADIQKSNENATKTRLSRARKKLKELLTDSITDKNAKSIFSFLI